jgi:hypothetical protein
MLTLVDEAISLLFIYCRTNLHVCDCRFHCLILSSLSQSSCKDTELATMSADAAGPLMNGDVEQQQQPLRTADEADRVYSPEHK